MLSEHDPSEGLLILRDGEPGELEGALSLLAYQHRAGIEAVVQGDARDAAFDPLTARIGVAVATYRTLGGLRDWGEGGRGALPVSSADQGRRPPEGSYNPRGAALPCGRIARLTSWCRALA